MEQKVEVLNFLIYAQKVVGFQKKAFKKKINFDHSLGFNRLFLTSFIVFGRIHFEF